VRVLFGPAKSFAAKDEKISDRAVGRDEISLAGSVVIKSGHGFSGRIHRDALCWRRGAVPFPIPKAKS